jgi:GDP-4-dehydro-6-deoxy-D-mannose reductase
MRVLVTGAAGFVGRHVVTVLKANRHEPLLTDMLADPGAGICALDICDATAVNEAVQALMPDACIHLAGVAFVPDAARDPTALNAINVKGPIHVADALLRHAPRARMLFVSSAQVYGYKYRPEPMTEADPLRPGSPYAISKAQAETALLERAARQGLAVIIARPGNHTGPGQSPKFVVPAFIRSIRRFRDGKQATIAVGNLESERDFTDVRDVVSAYLTLVQKGEINGIYNISAGVHLQIGELLARIAAMGAVEPVVSVDPSLYRPTDAMPELDTSRLRMLGWKPRFPFDRTLADLWAEAEDR